MIAGACVVIAMLLILGFVVKVGIDIAYLSPNKQLPPPPQAELILPQSTAYRDGSTEMVPYVAPLPAPAPKPKKTPLLWENVSGNSTVNGKWGLLCPKCRMRINNTKQPKICDCDQHDKEHYHFKCYDCGYQNVLRTADDDK